MNRHFGMRSIHGCCHVLRFLAASALPRNPETADAATAHHMCAGWAECHTCASLYRCSCLGNTSAKE